MKHLQSRIKLFILLAVFALLLTWSAPAQAAAPARLITGGSFTLQSGEVLDEDLVVLGGTVTLESGSTVNGDITLTAGSMTIAGTVTGDITVTSATLSLLSGAYVDGDIILAAAAFDRAEDARVTGEITQPGAFNRLSDRTTRLSPSSNGLTGDEWPLKALWGLVGYAGQVFLLAALAVLAAVFFDQPMSRVAHAAVQQPIAAAAMGLMTLVVALVAVLFLTITIIFIPLAILLVLALGLIAMYGWIALGFEVGERFAAQFKQVWAAPLSAGLGTLFFTAVLLGVGWVPCLGWTLLALVLIIGIGAAILTVLGTRPYVP